MFPVLSANGQSGYNLTKSLRFRSSATAYLNRTPASASNKNTWTWSGWIKRGKLTGYQMLFEAGPSGSVNSGIQLHNASDSYSLELYVYNAGYTARILSSQLMRDPAAWYHVVAVYDSANATASNRLLLYVNGVQVTALAVATYPAQNTNSDINGTTQHNIGQFVGESYYDGYMAEVNFVDGQALTPSSFGSFNSKTGVWQPAKYTGSYGTNGFYLPFTNTASTTTLGYDSSGNGNNWTTNNFSLTTGSNYDSMTDVPTLTSATTGNYAVLNPLDGNFSFGNCNLYWYSAVAAWLTARATMAVSSGKWYWEVTGTNIVPGSSYVMNGVDNFSLNTFGNVYPGATATSYGYLNTGDKYPGGIAYGASYGDNDVIGTALDLDAGTLTFYKNGVSQGVAFTGITGTYVPAIGEYGAIISANFGQRAFAYTPPTGHVALNTYNLPDSTVLQGNKVMDATLYTGNGTTNVITNSAGFKPDLVWMKDRPSVASNVLFDSVRGVTGSGGGGLLSNSTNVEDTTNTYENLVSFNSNGFTLGAVSSGNNVPNYSGEAFVGWQWQAGQGTTSSNTSGSITSTVSVNPTAGFSVVTYTGTGATGGTIGHGLGVAPSLIIAKNRTDTYGWPVYHKSLGSSSYFSLNTTDAVGTISNYWGTPNSTTFGVWNNAGSANNATGAPYIAYCWSEIAGFSKFGTYTGNYSVDGAFIYTGFRPKFILIKAVNNAYDWELIDTSRSPYNGSSKYLQPNLSNAEYSTTSDNIDILSNGFKMRNNWTRLNDTISYIYAAFAENPFKNALAR